MRNAHNKLSSYRTTISYPHGGKVDQVVITYVSTDIVSFDAATVTLRSGGYQTVTTKKKMNQAAGQFGLGYSVFQRNHEWFVKLPGRRDQPESVVPFRDGMTFARNTWAGACHAASHGTLSA